MKQLVDYIKSFLLLSLVTIVSAVVVMKVSMYSAGELVIVPDLRGKHLVHVLESLDRRGLHLKATRLQYDSDVPKDRIISQEPAPGESLKSGRDVKVVISRGAREALAPDLVGATQLRAVATLNRSGLKIQKVMTVHSNTVAKGVVMAQRPAAHSILRKGAAMTLLVSAGRYPENLMTPNLVDSSVTDAMTQLKSIGLKIRRVLYKPSMDKGRGVVISQEPVYGVRVAKGSLISLTVSEGSSDYEDAPATFTFLYYTVPDAPSAVKISIVQDNLDGEKEIYNRVHRSGDTVSLLLEVKGRTAAKIFLNDELVEVKRY